MTPGQLIRQQQRTIGWLSTAVMVLMAAFLLTLAAFINERSEKYEARCDADKALQSAIDQGIKDFKATKRPSKDRPPGPTASPSQQRAGLGTGSRRTND